MTTTLDAVTSVLRRQWQGDGGLMDSLRPYGGRLDAAAMAETRAAVLDLASLVERTLADVPPDVLSLVFHLTHSVRRWALDPDSMLVRNGLIRDDDHERLLAWTVEVEAAGLRVLGLLEDRH